MGICQFSHQKDMPVVALLHNNFLINMLKADYTEFIEQKLDLMSTVLFFLSLTRYSRGLQILQFKQI